MQDIWFLSVHILALTFINFCKYDLISWNHIVLHWNFTYVIKRNLKNDHIFKVSVNFPTFSHPEFRFLNPWGDGQKKKNKQWSTKYYTPPQRLISTNPIEYVGELRCLGRVSRSCSTSGSRRVTLATFFANNYEWFINVWLVYIYVNVCIVYKPLICFHIKM
jgi:hypothetical protein